MIWPRDAGPKPRKAASSADNKVAYEAALTVVAVMLTLFNTCRASAALVVVEKPLAKSLASADAA